MNAVFTWLLNQQPIGWVLFFASIIGVALLIVFDKLHTTGQVERELDRYKETIERQDNAINKKDETIASLVESNSKSLENDELILKVVRSIQSAVRRKVP